MEVRFVENGKIQIDEARICYRNFHGRGGKYNRTGDRNFAVIIPDEELADRLIEDGWNVKKKAARDDQDGPFCTLPVKIKLPDDERYASRGPVFYLVCGEKQTVIPYESIGDIDDMDIISASMDIRPYHWKTDDGKSGTSAYLERIEIIQRIDRFKSRYLDAE